MKPPALALLAAALAVTPARADLRVDFDEGAPVDRFTILNAGSCALEEATVTIDLSGSAGRLVFDVTGAGAGVEVFQPFRVVAGGAALSSLPAVADGDRAVTLAVRSLAPGERIAFTIDVDDTTSARGITVTGSEIEGASLRVEGTGESRFGTDSSATVKLSSCTS